MIIERLVEAGIIEVPPLPEFLLTAIGADRTEGVVLAGCDLELRTLTARGDQLPAPFAVSPSSLLTAGLIYDCAPLNPKCQGLEGLPQSEIVTFAGDLIKIPSKVWELRGDELLGGLRDYAAEFGGRVEEAFELHDKPWTLASYAALQSTFWACQAIRVVGFEELGFDSVGAAVYRVLDICARELPVFAH